MNQKVVIDCETGETSYVELSEAEENQIVKDQESYIEILWTEIRSERNARLAASDYVHMSDSPPDPKDWKEYRQELRDLPENVDDPYNVEWPTPPEPS